MRSTTATWRPAWTASPPTRSAPTSATWANTDLDGRIGELSEAGARLARQAADRGRRRAGPAGCSARSGPGTKLPTLGHVAFAELRDAYQLNAAGLLRGGVDAIIIETCQDLLQAKAAIIGARRAIAAAGAAHRR